MKKRICLICSFVLTFVLLVTGAGCSEGGGKGDYIVSDPTDDPTLASASEAPVSVNKMPVFDKNGAMLGEIDSRAICSAAGNGIFYSIFELGEYEFTATAEYRFFNQEDNTDALLGLFEGQGYEAYYTRTELDGRIYTLAVKGKAGGDSVPLVLLSFDPAQKSMKSFNVSDNGFPYADMAAVNGKILIMNHEMAGQKADKIYEFDPVNETMKEVLSFSAATDSLRGISACGNGFYLLRLKINGGENELFVDQYDGNYAKKSEQSVNDIMVKAILTIPGIIDRQDALNELGMNVAHFSISNGRYMFYENFGMARVVVDLQTGETLLAKEDLHAISPGDSRPVVYRMDFDNDNIKAAEITGFDNGKPVNYDFRPTDSHKMVRTVSISDAGTWVITTSDDSRAFFWTLAVYVWNEYNSPDVSEMK